VSIVILDAATASKIAAGEVIERPASVVKELVENALDAGARRVEVEVREAGRELIRVSDDGCGMTRQDAALALERYATSKIRSADDLHAVSTFGFRGEALPSIAAVSHLTMVTRPTDAEAGVRLAAVGGEVVEVEEVGAPVGTQISVSRLFYNTPARLKFLKSDSVETGHIVEVMTRFLFSNRGVTFRLTQDGREILQHAGAPDLRASVLSAWGRELAEGMLPVELAIPGMTIHGLVSGLQVYRASRNRQFVFINGRWVRNRTLTHALDDAYRGALPESRHPAAVLLLEIEPGAVDVNVHPTKGEVRLSREWEVHHLVSRAVREALAGEGTGAHGDLSRAYAPSAAAAGPIPGGPAMALPGGWAGTLVAPGVMSAAFRAQGGGQLELRPLAQLRQTYILAEGNQGLLLVDQHRAQERIYYERFTQARLSQGRDKQSLLSPAVVQLGPREASVLGQQMEELAALGFELESFGTDAYLVRGVPAELARTDPATLVKDLAEELTAEASESSVERRRERILITLSCRSAVKAGDPLTYDEMVELLQALTGTARPYTCPHGWPIVMTISNFEIDRKFNR
jgi:DNA mismatch repair protein MutL